MRTNMITGAQLDFYTQHGNLTPYGNHFLQRGNPQKNHHA